MDQGSQSDAPRIKLAESMQECIEQASTRMMPFCKDKLSPCDLEDMVCGVNLKVSRAYMLGLLNGLGEDNGTDQA